LIDLSHYAYSLLRTRDPVRLRGTCDGRASILLVQAEKSSLSSRMRLENEYSLRGVLEEEWSALPLTLSIFNERWTLVLTDPGGQPLDRLLDGAMGINRFLKIAIGITHAISGAHARNVIHKDIKPANILFCDSTATAWLTGFGVASTLAVSSTGDDQPYEMAGTLAYMAPEQTGHMNRLIDTRSDLYSLGVTLYEVLTQSLPFTATDSLELIHCHMVRQPTPPADRIIGMPAQVSAIIMRLLAKNPESRYQTGEALEADLRRCLAEWEAAGKIRLFPLGSKDYRARLVIKEKLYGRQKQIETLRAAFDLVIENSLVQVVLVSGAPGIGKSSIVRRVQRDLPHQHGIFAVGKCDQYARDIPYAPLAQAFQGLLGLLMNRSDVERAGWRKKLKRALGSSGRLIVDLVPALQELMGQQPPVPELPAEDARNRFRMVFRQFVSAFARKEHPLTLFLDDIQWLDSASLDILEDLTTHSDIGHLLLIGAHRDADGGASNAVAEKLDKFRTANVRVNEVALGPLDLIEVEELVADVLQESSEKVGGLAALVHGKTGGNPFFVTQFLGALVDDELLFRDQLTGNWAWDIGRIEAKSFTDNVVELMGRKLKRLSGSAQNALTQFACLGNTAETHVLCRVLGQSAEVVHDMLREATEAGLTARHGNTYKFSHDRIHQAAYALVSVEQRMTIHLRIGRALFAEIAIDEAFENAFQISDQFKRCAPLLSERDERVQIAAVHLNAGKRAIGSSAYISANTFIAAGMALLDDEDWQSRYDLVFSLWLERAKCELLVGNFKAAQGLLDELLKRTTSTLDKAKVYHSYVLLHIFKSENQQAVARGRGCLALLGIDIPEHPSSDQTQSEVEDVWKNLGQRTIDGLISMPVMSDPELLAAMNVLSTCLEAAYFSDFDLFAFFLCRMANLSLIAGTSGASAFGFSLLGTMVFGRGSLRYSDGYQFTKLAHDLVERHGFGAYRGKVYLSMGQASRWTQPITTAIDLYRKGYVAASECGDMTFACYNLHQLTISLLMRCDPLDMVWRESEKSFDFAVKAKFEDGQHLIVNEQRFIANMLGHTSSFSTFNDMDFNEEKYEAALSGERMSALVASYWVIKLKARFLSGDFDEALAAANRAKPLLWALDAQIGMLDYFYYSALVIAVLEAKGDPAEERSWRIILPSHIEQLRIWNENCASTFADKHALLSAELARLEHRENDAMRLYEQAVRLAQEQGFHLNEGIAHEAAARFYQSRDVSSVARACRRSARRCYVRWGALGKVRHLERTHKHLDEEPESVQEVATSTFRAPIGQVDIATVIKASHAVSGELDLDQLIETLLRIVVEYGSAARGILLLSDGEKLRVEAEAKVRHGGVEVTLRGAEELSNQIPETVIQHVLHAQESLILDDASAPNAFSNDEYLNRERVRSLLCLPMARQGQIIGMLYLENDQTPRVFNSAKLAVLEVVASQAAISLHSARLYNELRRNTSLLNEAERLSQTGSFAWNPSTAESHWSEETFRIFGYERENVPSDADAMRERIHPEDYDKSREVWERAAYDRLDYSHRFRLQMSDRSVKFIYLVAHAVQGPNGERGFVGAIMDVTAATLAEAQLHKTRTELAHVTRVTSLGELTASIAHEVNQPLGAVVTNAEACLRWLSREQPDLSEARAAVERIVKEGGRAGDVIRRVRALVKKTDTSASRLDINDVVREAAAFLQHELQSSRVSLRMEGFLKLPDVYADRVQIQQVILNLMINGMESMQSITDRPRELLISTELDETRQVRVAVADTGVGLLADAADQIFESFFTTKTSGMGMGLSICRSIIDAHRGKIWATARVPFGAMVQFTIPLYELDIR